MSLTESYLIYIDKIERASIKKNPDDLNKYYNLSKSRIVNSIYNTYDSYLRNKYKIDINHKALNSLSR